MSTRNIQYGVRMTYDFPLELLVQQSDRDNTS